MTLMQAGAVAPLPPPDAVVFDFGGVLFNWQPVVLLQQVMPDHARNAEEALALAHTVFQSFMPDGDWAAFDRGTAEWDEVRGLIARRTGLPVAEVASALKAMKRAPLPLDEMLASSGGAAFVAPVSVEDAAGELDLCSVFVAAVAGLQPLYRIVLVLAVYKGYDDEKIVAEVPELSGDHMISSHALSWVAHLREQAICEVLGVLRTHLGAAEVELPRRARPAPRGRRASTPSSEPEGAVSLAMLAAG